MDITDRFLQIADQKHRQAIGARPDDYLHRTQFRKRPSFSHKKKYVFAQSYALQEILSRLLQFHQFFAQNRIEYLNTSKYFTSKKSALSDTDRDLLDQRAKQTSSQFQRDMEDFQQSIETEKKEDQHNIFFWTHAQLAGEILQLRFQALMSWFSDHRILRFKQQQASFTEQTAPQVSSDFAFQFKKPVQTEKSEPEEFVFTEDERQELELDSKQLAHTFETELAEARLVHRQISDISELQQNFAAKLAVQLEGVQTIHTLAITVNQNLEKGNEELVKATRAGSNFRLFVLLVLILLSFSLLFLHWISP